MFTREFAEISTPRDVALVLGLYDTAASLRKDVITTWKMGKY